MKRFGFIFFLLFSISVGAHTEDCCHEKNLLVKETVFFSALAAAFYEVFGVRVNINSLKHKYKGRFEKEINCWIKDTGCLLTTSLSNVFYEEFFKKLVKGLKKEHVFVNEKKLSSIFKKNFRFFSKLYDFLPGLYNFAKNKLNKCSKKALLVSFSFNAINAILNSKVNQKIDSWGDKKENFKTLNKTVAKSAWFLSKHLILNEIFEKLILITLFLSSKSDKGDQLENDMIQLGEINKQTYNLADFGIISWNAAKSF